MGIKIRGSCLGCLLLALILQGAVCQDDRCRTFVFKTVTIGQDRTIHCNVSCGDPRRIEWGQQGSDDRVSQGPNYIIRDIRNISIGGMVYWCQCPGDDQNRQCFKILVNPHIFKFITEPSEVTVGSAFTLICKAEGYPAPQPQDYHLGRVVHVPNVHVPQMYHPVPLGVEVTIANVTVEYTGNYSCVVNVGSELHTTSNTARVTVYEPPKLRGIRNFTMSNGGSNQSAILECMIERTPSAEVVMEWRRNDILLSSSWKYVNWTVNLDSGSNLLVAILVVRDVSDGDLGAYECRLYSNYSYLRSRSEDVMEAWIMAPDAPNTPTTEGVGECDCGSPCTGAVVAAVIDPVVVFILVAVIAIIVVVTLWRKQKKGVCTVPAQDEHEMVPNQHAMDSVQPLAQNEQDRNHANTTLHVPSDEGCTPPLPHPEHDYRESNQSANHYPIAEVAQDEQGMDNHLPMEAVQSANVPHTGEGDVHPEQDEQEKTATSPHEDHTLSANTGETTTNNQLGDQVGDGSPQSHAPDSDRPTLDKEQHFVPRRGSHSSHNDPDVRRESKPTPISPLVRVVAASSQSPRSPTKKRRFSIPSFPSKRQSQVENGEEKKLLELPKTPKSLSHRRQSKSENDEERNLLKEQSPVDEEHPTIGDGHTSDDQ